MLTKRDTTRRHLQFQWQYVHPRYASPATATATETVSRIYNRHDFDTDRVFLRYDLAPDAIRSKVAALAPIRPSIAANESSGPKKSRASRDLSRGVIGTSPGLSSHSVYLDMSIRSRVHVILLEVSGGSMLATGIRHVYQTSSAVFIPGSSYSRSDLERLRSREYDCARAGHSV